MNDLIGKKFRRNKYGLSLWEDTIIFVDFKKSWVVTTDFKHTPKEQWGDKLLENDQYGYTIKVVVIGKLTGGKIGSEFPLDEIIIYP